MSVFTISDFPNLGANPKVWEASTFYLAKFSLKLHENEENWAKRRGRCPSKICPCRYTIGIIISTNEVQTFGNPEKWQLTETRIQFK